MKTEVIRAGKNGCSSCVGRRRESGKLCRERGSLRFEHGANAVVSKETVAGVGNMRKEEVDVEAGDPGCSWLASRILLKSLGVEVRTEVRSDGKRRRS